MAVNAEDDTTRTAWVLMRTGPHQAWHVVEFFATEHDAKVDLWKYKQDGHTDGLVIRKVTLSPAAYRWVRK